MSKHLPVMLKEVLDYLKPELGDIFIDGTLGGGSYSLALAKVVKDSGMILAIDLDEKAIERFEQKIKSTVNLNIKVSLGNFADIDLLAKKQGIKLNSCSGIVLDLGLSSFQLDDKERGFSFQGDGPLNMAFSEDLKQKTIEIVNNYSLSSLVKIFKEYGQTPHANRVARAIVSLRRKERIARVKQLIEIINGAVKSNQFKKINPATLYFQALRIETNKELSNLKKFLPAAYQLLKKGGRLVIVSFHSGEDRIVKNFFKQESANCQCPKEKLICSCQGPKLKVLTKKPIGPSLVEVRNNPRARSAKLRAAIKI